MFDPVSPSESAPSDQAFREHTRHSGSRVRRTWIVLILVLALLVTAGGILTALYPVLLFFAAAGWLLTAIGLTFIGWLQLAILAARRAKLLLFLLMPFYIVRLAIREWPASRRGVVILGASAAWWVLAPMLFLPLAYGSLVYNLGSTAGSASIENQAVADADGVESGSIPDAVSHPVPNGADFGHAQTDFGSGDAARASDFPAAQHGTAQPPHAGFPQPEPGYVHADAETPLIPGLPIRTSVGSGDVYGEIIQVMTTGHVDFWFDVERDGRLERHLGMIPADQVLTKIQVRTDHLDRAQSDPGSFQVTVRFLDGGRLAPLYADEIPVPGDLQILPGCPLRILDSTGKPYPRLIPATLICATGDGRLVCVSNAGRGPERVIVSRSSAALTQSSLIGHQNPSQFAADNESELNTALEWYPSHMDRISRASGRPSEAIPEGFEALAPDLHLVPGTRLKANIDGQWHDVTLVYTYKHSTLIILRDGSERELQITRDSVAISVENLQLLRSR